MLNNAFLGHIPNEPYQPVVNNVLQAIFDGDGAIHHHNIGNANNNLFLQEIEDVGANNNPNNGDMLS